MSPEAPSALGGDDDLVRRWRDRRDEDALHALIVRHWTRAHRIAWRIARDPALAEDAAQRAFVKVASGARGYALDGGFGAWIARIAVNEALNVRRGELRRERHEVAAATGRGRGGRDAGGEDGGDEAERAAAVDAHLADLPDELRVPLVLRYQEGLTHEAVAGTLGVAPGTASSRIRRGLERLRESLAQAGFAAGVPAIEVLLGRVPAPPPTPAAPTAAAIAALAATAAARLARRVALWTGGGALVAALVMAVALLGGGPATPLRSEGPSVERASVAQERRPADAPATTASAPRETPAVAAAASGAPDARAPDVGRISKIDADAPAAPTLAAEEAPAGFAILRVESETERDGRRDTSELLVRRGGGYLERRGDVEFGFDGDVYWVHWPARQEAIVARPLGGEAVAARMRERTQAALGRDQVVKGMVERARAQGTLRTEVRGGRTIDVIPFTEGDGQIEGTGWVDRETGFIVGADMRASPPSGRSFFVTVRCEHRAVDDLGIAFFRGRVPTGAAPRPDLVAEGKEGRAVIVEVRRDRAGRVRIVGFREGAAPETDEEGNVIARHQARISGRDDRGTAYRAAAPGDFAVGLSGEELKLPSFGAAILATLVPSSAPAPGAPAAKTIDVDLGDLCFRAVRLPALEVEEFEGFEDGLESPPEGTVITTQREVRLTTEVARTMLRRILPDVTDAEERALLERARKRALTVRGVREVLGAERGGRAAAALDPKLADGDLIVVSDEPEPAPPAEVRHVMELTMADLAEIVPDLTPGERSACLERSKAGTLDEGGLREVLGEKRAAAVFADFPEQYRGPGTTVRIID